MDHPIDPKTDCVFKALLGAEDNRDLLIHFLNAILGADLPSPVTQVDILNPYNEREFVTDKLSIVDVKARDDYARLYQAEIQLVNHRDLPARILYTWADLYSQQLQSGQDYDALQPTYSIWLLGEDLLRGDPCYAHRYRLRDERDRCLLDHGGIYLFELNKFAAEQVETEEQRWLKFFKDGEHLNADHLPVEATSGHDRASPGRATAAPNAAGGRSHRRPVRISRTSRPCRASRTTTASSSFPIAHG